MSQSKVLLHELVRERQKRQNQHGQYHWTAHARDNQLPPMGDWRVWMILAGRGFGKTRTGAETIRAWASSGRYKRIALVGQTWHDARSVMVEGESGLLAVHPFDNAPLFEPSKHLLTWPNGTVAQCFSGDQPDQLRGPQFDAAWVDELAKFQDPGALWDQLMMSVRLGADPKIIVTSTPRPHSLIKALCVEEGVVVTRGTTFDNQANLAPSFLTNLKERYQGTKLGQQEIEGMIVEDQSDALWTWAMIEDARYSGEMPALSRIVVAIDPAVTHNKNSDETGIVVAGAVGPNQYVVLEDLSGKYPTHEWARVACDAFHTYEADQVVVEVNHGGDLVQNLLSSIDGTVPVQPVRATRGKWLRAESIASLYREGYVKHLGGMAKLEDQMRTYTPGASGSPDRLDALVWALTALHFSKPQVTPSFWEA